MDHAKEIFDLCRASAVPCTVVFLQKGSETEETGYVEGVKNGVLVLVEVSTRMQVEIILDDVEGLLYPMVHEVSEGVFKIVRGLPPC